MDRKQRLGHPPQARDGRQPAPRFAPRRCVQSSCRPSARNHAGCRAGCSRRRAALTAAACVPSAPHASPAPPIDLQCTGRNQPSRISWAIPRASLRSDFTVIALKASRTCRVSKSSTARPACSQGRVQPLRQRACFKPDPCHRETERRKPGDQCIRLARNLALAQRSCRSPSTTHTLEHSNDTSIPA